MSIPVHFNGSLLNIMGGGGSTPPVGSGAELHITNFTATDTSNAILVNGSNVIELGYTPGPNFSGGIISGGAATPPMSGSIASNPTVPSTDTATFATQFAFIADITGAVRFDFNASYTAASYPAVNSTIIVELKLHDDTASLTSMDWFPDTPPGGSNTQLLAPFSLNTAITTSSTMSGHFRVQTIILTAGHQYTLTVFLSVVNT